MAFELPKLKYAYDALEPHIDARTMEIHHSKHHNGYTTKLNAAIEGTDLEGKSIEDILGNLDMSNAGVRNNGGGFYNHDLYWSVMGPGGGGEPAGELASSIKSAFGSLEAFKSQFNTAAATRFGSGWAWLVKKSDGSLVVTSFSVVVVEITALDVEVVTMFSVVVVSLCVTVVSTSLVSVTMSRSFSRYAID